MCDFGITAGLAISAASAAASYAAQADAARKQQHYQNDMFRQGAASSLESFQNQTNAIGQRIIQNDEQAAQALQQNSIAAMTARSHALVSGLESGAAGGSLNSLFDDFSRTEAMNAYTIQTDKMWQTDNLTASERQMQAEAQSRINAGRPGPVNEPSSLGLALQIGTAGLTQYDRYQQRSLTGPYSRGASVGS